MAGRVIVVLTTMETESLELPGAMRDTAVAKGEPTEYVRTETWRIEFASYALYKDWLEAAQETYADETNKLVTM